MSEPDGPLVGILVGSESDRERMQGAMDELDARGIAWEFDVRSAHRHARRGRRVRADGAGARPARADLRRGPRGGAARRGRGAHRPAGDRRPAALVAVGARRPRRAARDRADAAGRARSRPSASTTRRTRACWPRASSAPDRQHHLRRSATAEVGRYALLPADRDERVVRPSLIVRWTTRGSWRRQVGSSTSRSASTARPSLRDVDSRIGSPVELATRRRELAATRPRHRRPDLTAVPPAADG